MAVGKQHIQSVLGRNLMILRKAHKLTQVQVADILKIKRSTYAYYERDITPTTENIRKLATLFDVSVHFLLYGVEEKLDVPYTQPLGTENEGEKIKLKDLKKGESEFLGYFRLLSSQNKEKILKEIIELYEKSI